MFGLSAPAPRPHRPSGEGDCNAGYKDEASCCDDESRSAFRRRRGVVAAASLVFVASIASPPRLMDDVDAVQAQIARNMLASGDWVTARLTGRLPREVAVGLLDHGRVVTESSAFTTGLHACRWLLQSCFFAGSHTASGVGPSTTRPDCTPA